MQRYSRLWGTVVAAKIKLNVKKLWLGYGIASQLDLGGYTAWYGCAVGCKTH